MKCRATDAVGARGGTIDIPLSFGVLIKSFDIEKFNDTAARASVRSHQYAGFHIA
jgi:hypothetical protein